MKLITKQNGIKKIVYSVSLLLAFLSLSVNAQNGYIYVHSKALNEIGSPDITYSVSGGSTVVSPFTLNDNPGQNMVLDIGAAENGRLWAASRTNELYYRNANSTIWVNTGVTGVSKVDGGPGGTCYYINTAGTIFNYTGSSAPTQISTVGQFASTGGWNDVGSGWTGTATAAAVPGPAIYAVRDNNLVYKYSGSGTTWNVYATFTPTNFTGYRVDVNPTTGDVYVGGNAGTVRNIRKITPAFVFSILGSPVPDNVAYRDIAVNANGELYVTANNQSWYVHKYNSGTSWTTEFGSFDASQITGGVAGTLWTTMNSGGTNGVPSTVPFYNIFSRAADGTSITYIDDERVRTTTGNSQLIPVSPGTYTITETIPAGWDLQKILVYDPTANSSTNENAATATIVVAANEVVHVVFQTGQLNPVNMERNCDPGFVETFGSGTAGSFGPEVPGQSTYHYLTNNAGGEDGYYKIVSRANPDFNSWSGAVGVEDHTPNTNVVGSGSNQGGGAYGYMYAVNAGFDKGEFFRRHFTNVVPGAFYDFSAWIVDLTASAIVNPNVSFTIYDHNTQAVLGTYSTGELTSTVEPGTWNKYGFIFQAPAGATDIDLVIGNNGFGGNGNDLALDDITFRLYMPPPVINIVNATCTGATGSITVTSPVSPVFEYVIDNISGTWQTSTTFNNVPLGIHTIYARYIGSTNCVVSKTDTVKAAICGTVYNDVNGLTDLTVNGTGTNAGGTLIAVLYDITTGKVVDTDNVTALGSYTLYAYTGNNYAVYLTTTPATIGQTATPAITLPGSWLNTGEYLGSGVGNDLNANGVLSLGTVNSSLQNANFGIEQPPVAVNDAATGTLGNAVTVSVLGNDSDPTPGSLDPTRVSMITPGGATGVTTDAQGDVTGFTVTGQGTWAVNTATGAITFTPVAGFVGNPTPINYTVRDNAGVISNQATVTITYPTVNITGTVVNDVNNSTTILDGSETGTTAGTNLYVYLISPEGEIVDSARVAANGTYTLQASPSTAYTLELSTTQYIIGTTGVVAATINNTAPSGWVTTGEGASNTDDGTANGVLTLTTGVGNTGNANFGIEQPPVAVNDAATGTLGNAVTVSVLGNDSDPTPGSLDPTRVSMITPGGATGITTDAQGDVTGFTVTGQGTWAVDLATGAITFTPVAGFVGNPTPINYTVRDNAVVISNQATVTITYPTVNISGTVVNDVNNSTTILDGSETGTTAGTNLYVYLISPEGEIVDSARVAANGTYTLQASPSTAYTLELSTTQYIIGTTGVVAATINNTAPSGWVTTGEGASNTDDGTANGVLTLTTGVGNTSNVNFGIEQPPVSVNDAATGTLGNAVTVSVLGNDSDPTPGSLDPTRVSMITPGGATGVTTDAQGDVTGFTVTGQGTWAVDPSTGAITFTPVAGFVGNPTPINYTVRDNAGIISNQANVTITYPIVNITGMVVNDINNSTSILDGTETGTTAGTNLYVYLISPEGEIVDSAKVAANGTYTLQASPSTAYTLELSTTQYTIGTTGVVASTINNTAPTGWVTTGEGASNTDDGTANGVLSLTTGLLNSSIANFGIQQPPTATSSSMPSQINNQGSYSIPVPNSQFGGTDFSGGTIQTITFTSFPTNTASITIDGIKYGTGFTPWPAGGVTVPATTTGQPMVPVYLDPVNGITSAVISYVTVDNVGAPSAAGTVTIPFTVILPVTGLEVDIINTNTCEHQINWQTLTEVNALAYELQYSTDGNTWKQIATISAIGNSNSRQNYQYINTKPVIGKSYYRIKATDRNGSFIYSPIKTITTTCKAVNTISVYPNPVKDILTISGAEAGSKLVLADATGKILLQATASGSNTDRLFIGNVATGMYLLQVVDTKGDKKIIKVNKQ